MTPARVGFFKPRSFTNDNVMCVIHTISSFIDISILIAISDYMIMIKAMLISIIT